MSLSQRPWLTVCVPIHSDASSVVESVVAAVSVSLIETVTVSQLGTWRDALCLGLTVHRRVGLSIRRRSVFLSFRAITGRSLRHGPTTTTPNVFPRNA